MVFQLDAQERIRRMRSVTRLNDSLGQVQDARIHPQKGATPDCSINWSGSLTLTSQQLPQHVGQNSPMLVIINFDWSVDPAGHVNTLGLSVGPSDSQAQILLRFEVGTEPQNIIRFGAIELQALRIDAFLEL